MDAFSWGSIVLGGGPLAVGSEFERRLSIGANIACRLRKCIRDQLGVCCAARILLYVSQHCNHPISDRAVVQAETGISQTAQLYGMLGVHVNFRGKGFVLMQGSPAPRALPRTSCSQKWHRP